MFYYQQPKRKSAPASTCLFMEMVERQRKEAEEGDGGDENSTAEEMHE